ncbi:MAG: Cna B-type domain-containing protein [Absicoccus sp.]|uniref:Cna B-type domain-containing protein n=1 Tax=Absicoccus sp. TaxID=2718527 RepID=UPI002A7596E3|nr:Cna B-type domain-containing protein [Absicoccus sp.]MDY3034829.1 Cna B-type domain-containing protein [Absicoccus sp.]
MKRKHVMGLLFAATMVCSNFGSVPIYAQETTNYNEAGTVQLLKDETPIEDDTKVTINDQLVMELNDVNFDGTDLTLNLPNIDVQEDEVKIDGQVAEVETTDNKGQVSELTLKSEDISAGTHSVTIPFTVQKDTIIKDVQVQKEQTTDDSTNQDNETEVTDQENQDNEADTTLTEKTSSQDDTTETKDITLTLDDTTVKTVSLQGVIDWDTDIKDSQKPEEVKVSLLANGQPTGDSYEVKGSDWKFTFGQEPKYADEEQKEEVNYSVEVEPVENFTSEVKTNKKSNATVKYIDVDMTADTTSTESTTDTKSNEDSTTTSDTKSDSESTTKSDSGSTTTNNSQTNIELKQNNIEVNVENVQQNNILVVDPSKDTEVLATDNADETVNVQGKIVWKDDSDKNKQRPKTVTVILYANNKQFKAMEVQGSSDEWTFEFDGLPKNDENGKAYSYTIKEKALSHYRGDVDGYTLTNTYIAENTQTTSGTNTGTQTNTGLYIGVGAAAIVVIVILVALKRKQNE